MTSPFFGPSGIPGRNDALRRFGVAIVTGATGQDGYFLTRMLLDDDWTVHAVARRPEALRTTFGPDLASGRLVAHQCDLLIEPGILVDLIARIEPDAFYHLAGETSVGASFAAPRDTWLANVEATSLILEGIRLYSSATRFYHSSSGDMFGSVPGGSVIHDEDSPLNPQSPYASSKAAAHLLCKSYRESNGLRIACGILFNHESHRRSDRFLTRKVIDHVVALRMATISRPTRPSDPLRMGNLKAQRDWGFAPEYAHGIRLILDQIDVRAARSGTSPEPDSGQSYRDYVLGTGSLHAVWQLVDRAFALAGFELEWRLDGGDSSRWGAWFAETGAQAVAVDPAFLRPADPVAIQANPERARRELGWQCEGGLDVFLRDMLEHALAPVDTHRYQATAVSLGSVL